MRRGLAGPAVKATSAATPMTALLYLARPAAQSAGVRSTTGQRGGNSVANGAAMLLRSRRVVGVGRYWPE